MTTALDVPLSSLTDFLAWEQQQPDRYERVGGIVRMMTGGTIDHSRIIFNAAQILERQLRARGCEVFTNNVKVVTPDEDVMYPDVVVVCGEIAGKATWVGTPIIVVEVLSDSTAGRDQGRKRWAYQTIPSLKYYLLIDQNEPAAEVASRGDDDSWRSLLHRGLDARLRLEALGVELGLDEIFARVTFAPAAPAESSG